MCKGDCGDQMKTKIWSKLNGKRKNISIYQDNTNALDNMTVEVLSSSYTHLVKGKRTWATTSLLTRRQKLSPR